MKRLLIVTIVLAATPAFAVKKMVGKWTLDGKCTLGVQADKMTITEIKNGLKINATYPTGDRVITAVKSGLTHNNSEGKNNSAKKEPVQLRYPAQIVKDKVVVGLHWYQDAKDPREFWMSGGVGTYSVNSKGQLVWLRKAHTYEEGHPEKISAWTSECRYKRVSQKVSQN